jgi:hypothetical protein
MTGGRGFFDNGSALQNVLCHFWPVADQFGEVVG